MSRRVVRDVVIPIVSKIMREEGYFTRYGRFSIRDRRLEDFLEEEMRRHFGVIGSNGCQHLREQLEEAKKNDPYSFQFLIKRLVNRYIKLSAKIKYAKRLKKIEEVEEGPPDRFSELRKEDRLRGF